VFWAWGVVLAWLVWAFGVIVSPIVLGTGSNSGTLASDGVLLIPWLVVTVPVYLRWRAGFALTTVLAGFLFFVFSDDQYWGGWPPGGLVFCAIGFLASAYALISRDLNRNVTANENRLGRLWLGFAGLAAMFWATVGFSGSLMLSSPGQPVSRYDILGTWTGETSSGPRTIRFTDNGMIFMRLRGGSWMFSNRRWSVRQKALHLMVGSTDGRASHHVYPISLSADRKTLNVVGLYENFHRLNDSAR
jgi:hypothetical protein